MVVLAPLIPSTCRDPFSPWSEEAYAYLTYAYRVYITSHRISSSLVGLVVGVSHCHRRFSHFFGYHFRFVLVLLWLGDGIRSIYVQYVPIYGEPTIIVLEGPMSTLLGRNPHVGWFSPTQPYLQLPPTRLPVASRLRGLACLGRITVSFGSQTL
jgi:hypothetical protein